MRLASPLHIGLGLEYFAWRFASCFMQKGGEYFASAPPS
jgi:hypothetical protein